jgi:hypothetical protein
MYLSRVPQPEMTNAGHDEKPDMMADEEPVRCD